MLVWDVEAKKELYVFKGHTSVVSSVAVLNATTIVSSSWDQTIRV